jgi:molybdopterin synthase catalytic subunit/molybdopterin converting factor small subunit
MDKGCNSMRVTVLLFASYRELFGEGHLQLDVPDDATIEQAFSVLQVREPRLAELRRFTTFAVNREVRPPQFGLKEGDEIALLQPVSGGADVPLLEITRDRLDPSRCLDAVRLSGSGGIVTFVGSVRDVSEGKTVEYLEYEAYEPMAIDAMRRIIAEAKARWPVQAVAIQHRVGRLQIGDDAVAIAVSCPHRAEAFEACRYLIDRLKEVVPIWKKERGEGGEEWVGGPTLIEIDPIHDPAQD